MTKQEAIKRAVKDYYSTYPLVKDYADDFGWFAITNGYTSNLHHDVLGFYQELEAIDYLQEEDHEQYHSHFRPQELSFIIEMIEANNGWTKLESGADLPELNCDYKFIWVDGNYGECNLGGLKALFRGNKITHYRPIVEIPKPLY